MQPIIFFDSGLGGLTIFEAIKQRMPHTPCIYCFDNKFFPYGDKTENFLITRVNELIQKLCNAFNPVMVVIACNTASTVALPSLRSWIKIPVVGVVPAIKPAAKLSKNKCIGLIATEHTIKSQYTSQLIQNYANDCRVILVESNRLVKIAEKKLIGQIINTESIKKILAPFTTNQIIPDYIVLGCTHYQILLSELEQITHQYPIKWIHSADAIAKRVKLLLLSYRKSTTIEQPHFANLTFFTGQLSPSAHSSLNVIFKKKGLSCAYSFENIKNLELSSKLAV